MSNPAVFRLNKANIRGNSISIEDNIGESIHFHLGLVRFDLSISEFNNITQILLSVLNEQLNVANFNLEEQDEYFLERIAPFIPYIIDVEDDVIKVEEIKCLYETEIDCVVEDRIINSPIFKYYLGDKAIITDYEIKTDIWKSKEEALDYVANNKNDEIYIDEQNRILDGYKSLCIGIISGEITQEVKVKRIICKDENLKRILMKERREW